MPTPYSVRKSLAWMGITQGLQFFLQFGGSVVIARLLTPYDMGVFTVAVSIVGLLATVRAFGLQGYFVRAADLTAEVQASLFTLNAVMALVLALAIAGLSILGGALLQEDEVRHLLLVMALVPLLSIFEFLPSAGVEREGQFRAIAILSLARTLVSTAVMICLAFAGYSYMSLAYGQVASALVSLTGFNIVGRRYARLRLGLDQWRDITRYGLQILAINGVNSISSRLSELVLARLLGLSALGLFSRASGLYSILWDNVHLTIARILFVDFSKQRREGLSLREGYLRVLHMMTALLWPAFTGLAIISGPLVQLLYGKAWAAAALPLSLLSVAAIPLVSISMTYEVFVVCGETGRQAKFEFVRSGVSLAMFCAGCLISLTGAAAAKICEALFVVGLYRPHLERLTETRLADYVPIYRKAALLSLVASGPSAVTMTLNDWSPAAPLAQVAAGVLLGILGWVVCLRSLCPPLYGEGRLLVARLWSRLSPLRRSAA